MTIKPWLLALHHGLSLQEALHSASLWSSTQSIETPGERKLHVRSGCMECFFFFSPDRSLGSMSCSHSYIRIVWLILNVSACPFLRPVTAGLCLKLLLKLKHCQMEQPSNKPNLSPQLTYCPDKVLDGKVYTAGESSLRNPQPLACTLSEMSIGLLWTYFRDISTCQFRD